MYVYYLSGSRNYRILNDLKTYPDSVFIISLELTDVRTNESCHLFIISSDKSSQSQVVFVQSKKVVTSPDK